jgi:hypothetical protein
MNGEGISSGKLLNDIAERTFLGHCSHYHYQAIDLVGRKEPKNGQSIIKHQPVQTRKGLNHGFCHPGFYLQFPMMQNFRDIMAGKKRWILPQFYCGTIYKCI